MINYQILYLGLLFLCVIHKFSFTHSGLSNQTSLKIRHNPDDKLLKFIIFWILFVKQNFYCMISI